MSDFVLARSGRCVKKAFTSSYFATRRRPRFSFGNLFARAKARKVSGFTPKFSKQLSWVIVTGIERGCGAGMIEARTSREIVNVISSPGPLSRRIVMMHLAMSAELEMYRDRLVGHSVFGDECAAVPPGYRPREPCPRERARARAVAFDLGTSSFTTFPVHSFRPNTRGLTKSRSVVQLLTSHPEFPALDFRS